MAVPPTEVPDSGWSTGDPASFRRQVHHWLESHAPRKGDPDDFSSIHIVSATTPEEYRSAEEHALTVSRGWQRRLFEAGLAGRSWPAVYGGAAAPRWQDEVVADEQSRFGVSTKVLAVALEMLPPVLFAYGSEDQRAEYLPPVLRGEQSWCQLLSEPDAGSDLASLRTTATEVAGGWSVSGQKVWTSGAGSAAFALLIARTGPEPRPGLSCFAMSMSTPGVDVRPLRQMSGAYHFNEVFLEDAFVPRENTIGAVGEGWAVLRTMLASERAAIGGGTSARSAAQLIAMARGSTRAEDPVIRQRLAATTSRERLLDLLLSRLSVGPGVPAGGSLSKLSYSEHARLTADTAMSVLGVGATVADDPRAAPWVERLLFAPGLRIGGGTDEVQRNAIAERGLGLPR